MLPQHLVVEESEMTVTRLETGETGTLRLRVVYQARGADSTRQPVYRADFTADDRFQEWDDEDGDYNRTSCVATFTTREQWEAHVAERFGPC